jgi:phosphate transport system permease protein
MPAAFRSHNARIFFDRSGTVLAVAAVILPLIPLGAVIAFVIQRGASSLTFDFFTLNPPEMGMPGGGMYPMIVGSVIVVGLASAIGIPFGMLCGLFLARSRASKLASISRFVIDVIAGTPSILAGVIVAALIVIPTTNESALSAAIALALLMFPTVARAAEAAIRAVPSELHEAALALGAPEWKVMMRVTIPTAAAGLVTAFILGVARVAGETAPLYLTMGSNNFLSTNPWHGPMGSLPVQIWIDATTGLPSDANAAFAGALVLFILVAILNLLARILTYRLSRRTALA